VTQNTSSRRVDETAARRLTDAFSPDTIDALLKDAKSTGTPIDGVDGLLNQLTKAVLERALQAEMTDHLGYDAGDPAGHGTGNSRNGKTTKTVSTKNGPIEIDVPRDRNSSFEPAIVPKRVRRIGNIDDTILSLYSRGMTTRDIESHLLEIYGVNASRELISNVTEVVLDEIKAVAALGRGVPHPLRGRDQDPGQGQRRGHHQGRLPGHRGRRRRPQACPGLLDPGH